MDLTSADGAAAPEAIDNELLAWAARLRMVIVPMARRLRQEVTGPYTPSQLSVLASIHEHGPLNLSDLAGREGLSPPMISKIVVALEGHGLVDRLADPHDRRIWMVKTSDEGRTYLEEGRAQRNAFLAERIVRLTPEDKATLIGAIPALEQLLGVSE